MHRNTYSLAPRDSIVSQDFRFDPINARGYRERHDHLPTEAPFVCAHLDRHVADHTTTDEGGDLSYRDFGPARTYWEVRLVGFRSADPLSVPADRG